MLLDLEVLISRQSADREVDVSSGTDGDVYESSNEFTSCKVFHVSFIIHFEV
jgi:hypothetical protein